MAGSRFFQAKSTMTFRSLKHIASPTTISAEMPRAHPKTKPCFFLPPAPERIRISGWRGVFTKLEYLISNHQKSVW
jgi:hypothetical protein